MGISFDGIGQWAATFSCQNVREGDLVKISENGTVDVCADGDAFCGQAVSVSGCSDTCSVQLGGFITAGYSGSTVPHPGWVTLSADGCGGVKVSSAGRSYLAADVDFAAKTITFAL